MLYYAGIDKWLTCLWKCCTQQLSFYLSKRRGRVREYDLGVVGLKQQYSRLHYLMPSDYRRSGEFAVVHVERPRSYDFGTPDSWRQSAARSAPVSQQSEQKVNSQNRSHLKFSFKKRKMDKLPYFEGNSDAFHVHLQVFDTPQSCLLEVPSIESPSSPFVGH